VANRGNLGMEWMVFIKEGERDREDTNKHTNKRADMRGAQSLTHRK
jgi:hypothetical protein